MLLITDSAVIRTITCRTSLTYRQLYSMCIYRNLKSVVVYPVWCSGSTPVLTSSWMLANIFQVIGKVSLAIGPWVVHFSYQVLTRIAGFGPGARCLDCHLSLQLCLLLLLLPSWCPIRQQQLWQLWLTDHRQRAWRRVEGPPLDMYWLQF